MIWRPKEDPLEDQKSCLWLGRQDQYAEWIECARENGVSDENNIY